MSFVRTLGQTGLQVSAIGLGTVKFGRNTGVKYPSGFALPTDAEIRNLLAEAAELGINLLDTAPAYGSSEERLGALLPQRQQWVLVSKVGEEFDDNTSSFDFSYQHTTASIERSLRRLRTDYLDLVLIHSDGNDEQLLQRSECLPALKACQERGLVRYLGISSKTDAGGALAAELLDVVMLTYNLQQQDSLALQKARSLNKGVLVKKGLMSGHVGSTSADAMAKVEHSLRLVLGTAGIHSMVVGTLNAQHLRGNVALAKHVLNQTTEQAAGSATA
jgi:aryl-alcohol dehydrogenase-like predicted oxidoreductase